MNLIILALAYTVFFPAQGLDTGGIVLHTIPGIGVTHYVAQIVDAELLRLNLNRGSARGCHEFRGKEVCDRPKAKPTTATIMRITPDKRVEETTIQVSKIICWRQVKDSSAEGDDCVSNRGYWEISVPVKTDWLILGVRLEFEP